MMTIGQWALDTAEKAMDSDFEDVHQLAAILVVCGRELVLEVLRVADRNRLSLDDPDDRKSLIRLVKENVIEGQEEMFGKGGK